MNQDFQVVAELYRFLATFDPGAISAASKLPTISENLRAALIALHEESRNPKSTSTSTNSSSKTAMKKNGGSLDPLGLLMDSRRFPSKRELYELAQLLGVKVKEDAKESRERVARRIANIVAEDATACEKLYDLVGSAKDTQTAGWFDLIRRGS